MLEGIWHRGGIKSWLLYPFSLLYRLGVEARLSLYRRGVLTPLDPALKVVSVGNLTVGGSGKTPVTIYLARLLSSLGYRVGVLSRGYKGKGRGRVRVVSDGRRVLLSPYMAGDEPYLIASKLKGVPVLVGKDRYSLALHAKEAFGCEVVILDDGFQHLRLKRDVDILIITRDVFERPYLLPMGRLREPLRAVERADLVLLKDGGVDGVPWDKPVFSFTYLPSALRRADGRRFGVDLLKGVRTFAFSGIASPLSFLETLERAGAVVVGSSAYPDHYTYRREDLEGIVERARGADLIVTTEKDWVKLEGFGALPNNLYVLEVEVLFREEGAFDREVQGRLSPD